MLECDLDEQARRHNMRQRMCLRFHMFIRIFWIILRIEAKAQELYFEIERKKSKSHSLWRLDAFGAIGVAPVAR